MPGKVIYVFHWNALEASFCFTVIRMLKISISLANFIPVYFNGGQNFVMFLTQERSGNIKCGTTRRYV